MLFRSNLILAELFLRAATVECPGYRDGTSEWNGASPWVKRSGGAVWSRGEMGRASLGVNSVVVAPQVLRRVKLTLASREQRSVRAIFARRNKDITNGEIE